MKWDGFYNLMSQRPTTVAPSAIIFHLGGNDLTVRKGKSLIQQILLDLGTIRERFPETRLIWSNIIPRVSWRAQCDPRPIDCARRGVNREVGRPMRKGLGTIIEHPQLRMEWPELYRLDGVHLSEVGLNLFLEDIQRDIQILWPW